MIDGPHQAERCSCHLAKPARDVLCMRWRERPGRSGRRSSWARPPRRKLPPIQRCSLTGLSQDRERGEHSQDTWCSSQGPCGPSACSLAIRYGSSRSYRIGVINKPTVPDQVGHKLCHREVGSLVHIVEGLPLQRGGKVPWGLCLMMFMDNLMNDTLTNCVLHVVFEALISVLQPKFQVLCHSSFKGACSCF